MKLKNPLNRGNASKSGCSGEGGGLDREGTSEKRKKESGEGEARRVKTQRTAKTRLKMKGRLTTYFR